MAKQELKFIEAYRTASPAAPRDVVEARERAHQNLYPLIKTMDRFYDLCRISFQLPFNRDTVAEWFEETIKAEDKLFSLDIDKSEASLLATLVMRDCVSRGSIRYPLACLAASYCGRRAPGDGGAVLTVARSALNAAGEGRRMALADREIKVPKGKDFRADLDAMQGTFQGPQVRGVLDAVISDVRDSAIELAASADEAFASLKSDTGRLAEEVDMLWWYIGDWSEPLGKPRTELEPATTAVASAAELGDFVRELPGPHGVYGILRRALGGAADTKTSLKASIEHIRAVDLVHLAEPLSSAALPLFPVQAAINLGAERGTKEWADSLRALLGDVPAMEVSYHELAVQLFRERVLIRRDGLGQ